MLPGSVFPSPKGVQTMIEFYLWPRSVCYVITFAIVLCVLAQILTVMVSFYRYPRSRSRIFEAVLELFILGYVVVCSLLHGQAMMGYQIGLFAPGGYDGLRTFFFAAVSLCAILAFAGTRKPQTLIVLVFAGLTLPVTEQLTDHLFAYLYVAAILFWLARGVLTGLPRYREIKENLSALSVKNAMDSLHTGVMFCEPGGFIVLCNKQMQQLMTVTTGKIQRNGEQFFMLLASKEIDPACEIAWFEGQYTCLLPDGSAWIFARTDLKIKRKTYRQITATDITERWKLTEALRAQNKELTRRKDGLIRTLNNLQALSRERETQRARMRAHDILGERLTLLLRMVRGEPAPDYDLLRSLTARLMDELKERLVGAGYECRDVGKFFEEHEDEIRDEIYSRGGI